MTMRNMIDQIAKEIRRPQLKADGTIQAAIITAIRIYQKDRFRISDAPFTPSYVMSTVAGQSIYTGPTISSIFVVDYLDVEVGSTMQKMTRRTANEIHLLNQQNQQSGQPTDWAYEANSFVFYPIPSQVWNIHIGGHVLVPEPADLDEAGNPWMVWGEQLIRCHAKYEIAVHVTRNPTMAQAMSPDADGGPNGKPGETWRAWNRLKRETNKIKSTGRVRAMRF